MCVNSYRYSCLFSDKSNLSAFQSRISKTGSAFSDDEPLYDSVASDEDYSSIDTQSIKSVREEMKRDKPADVSQSSHIHTDSYCIISSDGLGHTKINIKYFRI